MNKILTVLACVIFGTATLSAQTTAVDFTINDCSGINHHLYGELDGGKVIVIAFVMPCSGCVIPSNDVQNVVETYATSHPGIVNMYLADDDALTTCADLMTWRNGHGLHLMPTFSDSALIQDHYGTPGMPKIVVLGGTDHHVYDIQNNTVDINQLGNAIDAALGISTKAGHIIKDPFMPLSVYPNPSSDRATLSMTAKDHGYANIQVVDRAGKLISTDNVKVKAGSNKFTLDLSEIAAGIYAVKVTTSDALGETKLVVRK